MYQAHGTQPVLAANRYGDERTWRKSLGRAGTTAVAPTINSRLISRWLIFDAFPRICLPPVGCWRGTSPSHAAKSRPRLKTSIGGAKVSIAMAVIGPTPGIVCNRRVIGPTKGGQANRKGNDQTGRTTSPAHRGPVSRLPSLYIQRATPIANPPHDKLYLTTGTKLAQLLLLLLAPCLLP